MVLNLAFTPSSLSTFVKISSAACGGVGAESEKSSAAVCARRGGGGGAAWNWTRGRRPPGNCFSAALSARGVTDG
jgi:hypothetical protein